eukprot:CAMPEP_0114361710 /NCGR_PEP_ID=MMETSP0101-20121206/25002_1 /TAXON_ID=38822 ORGANISM="Pteridomonas danica, Strain PT" /NCGR_SAMPLE_ID=MMETSP0101 /ASSEMBLY_ACC=CAM_ASM_000211 /LENGTH=396 /DNA_ID=CAMNT_0001506951 /DNA_START=17 /DNA_END=1204 /DNA_ORIENTATION=+
MPPFKEKSVVKGAMHKRLKDRGMELEDTRIEKAKPSWAIKKKPEEDRNHSTTGRDRSSTKSGRDRASSSSHGRDRASSSAHGRDRASSSAHHRRSSAHRDSQEHDGRHRKHDRHERRASSSNKSKGRDGHHRDRDSVEHSKHEKRREPSTQHNHHHLKENKSKEMKSWASSLSEQKAKPKTKARDLSSDSEDEFGGGGGGGGGDLLSFVDEHDYSRNTSGVSSPKDIESRILSSSAGQIRQLNWAAATIQKMYRLNSKSLRVRRRVCGTNTYIGDHGKHLLVLYGWLQKKGRFGWEHKYCFIDPRDGFFRYEPTDIHNGTLPPGKRTMKQSSFTEFRWNINGRYGSGGFDLHIVMPAEVSDWDKRNFSFQCFHKENVFRSSSEEMTNYWTDEIHEW